MNSISAIEPSPHESLQIRLDQVRRLLPLAAKHANRDSSFVHQLRIATREAIAALDTFGELMPAKNEAWLRKRLKRIRKATGDSRDLDVMLVRHQNSKSVKRKPLIRSLRRERRRSGRPLTKLYKRMKESENFDKHARQCLKALQSVPSERAKKIAMSRISNAFTEFLDSAPPLNTDDFAFHHFRVRAKHLRYCLELCKNIVPENFISELYPLVCQIQKQLGVINDRVMAAERLKRMSRKEKSKKLARQWKSMGKQEKVAAVAHGQRFLASWPGDRLRRARSIGESLHREPNTVETFEHD